MWENVNEPDYAYLYIGLYLALRASELGLTPFCIRRLRAVTVRRSCDPDDGVPQFSASSQLRMRQAQRKIARGIRAAA